MESASERVVGNREGGQVSRDRLKLLLAGFVGGGRAALGAISAAGFDVLPGPPKPTAPRLLREVGDVLRRAHREG